MTLAVFYWLSFALLLVTKTADVVRTIRWVPLTAETNPWARRVFGRFGLHRGLAIVSGVFLVVALAQYILVWVFCAPWVQGLNAGLGFFISWVQWEVARCNATGTHSRITLSALRCYQWWGRWWGRRQNGEKQ